MYSDEFVIDFLTKNYPYPYGIVNKWNEFKNKENNIPPTGMFGRDWEVLSVSNGNECASKDKTMFAWCLNRGWYINQVKQLSGNEIFSVGEDVEYGLNGRSFVIGRFDIFGDNYMYAIAANSDDRFPISGIRKKQKQPLFQTEDGKEIFEDTEVFCVNKNFNILSAYFTGNDFRRSDCKYFSTKELAEKWIEENEKCLSYKDVVDYYKKWWHPSCVEAYSNGLRQLVKEKINK